MESCLSFETHSLFVLNCSLCTLRWNWMLNEYNCTVPHNWFMFQSNWHQQVRHLHCVFYSKREITCKTGCSGSEEHPAGLTWSRQHNQKHRKIISVCNLYHNVRLSPEQTDISCCDVWLCCGHTVESPHTSSSQWIYQSQGCLIRFYEIWHILPFVWLLDHA